MTLPREVIPGRDYMITRRCTKQQPSAMSNHHHTVVFDRHGTLPAFTEHFHKMLPSARTLSVGGGRTLVQ